MSCLIVIIDHSGVLIDVSIDYFYRLKLSIVHTACLHNQWLTDREKRDYAKALAFRSESQKQVLVVVEGKK